MIAILDYDCGNLKSVENALKRLGAAYEVTADPCRLRSASHVIMPGVGAASSAMESLRAKGLPEIIGGLRQPVLGICIGVQLMCAASEEGNTRCLGIYSPKVRRFPSGGGAFKIPEMGWNTIEGLKGPLFDGIPEGAFVYYVHSYCPELSATETTAATEYASVRFSAALQKDNFFGVQFHPEKSGPVGAKILDNFIHL